MLWRGIFKLIEELAELSMEIAALNKVLGKLCVVPEGTHWDEVEVRSDGSPGEKPLRQRLIEETADVYAALDYLTYTNLTDAERGQIRARRLMKLDRYEEWGLTGVSGDVQAK